MIPGTFLRMGMLGCLLGGSLGCDETSPEEPPSVSCVTAADVPDDGNPCTIEACDNGAPVHTPRGNLPCYSGPQGTAGQGLCVEGTQTCDADGNPVGGCEGEVIPAAETCDTPGDDDCDGLVNEEGASCACAPGAVIDCYSADPLTEDVGLCHGGTQTCEPSGLGYGPCSGEVTPQADACATPDDEDCDGAPAICAGSHIWSKRFGSMFSDLGFAVTMDGAGNTVVTGAFSHTIDFGGGTLSSVEVQDDDIFLAKFDPDGNHLWSKSFGDYDTDSAHDVAVDAAGNVLITGWFSNPMNLGGDLLMNAGSNDAFLAKYDPDGNHLWSKSFGGPDTDLGSAVAVDGAGNVVLLGMVGESGHFGGDELIGAGGFDIVVAKYDADGNHIWSQRLGGSDLDDAGDVAVDGAGDVVLTGGFIGFADFGGGTVLSAGNMDILVVKLDADGNYLWSTRAGDTGNDRGDGVAMDGANNIVLSGDFLGTIDLGGGALSSEGVSDVFIAKLDADGNHLWSKGIGGPQTEDCLDVAVGGADQDQIVITGSFTDKVDFGGVPLSAMGTDIFVAKYDAGGDHVWSKQFDGAYPGYPLSVAVNSAGEVVASGSFYENTDFGGGTLICEGSLDVYLAKLTP